MGRLETYIIAFLIVLLATPATAQYSIKNEFQPFLTRSKTTWDLGAGFRINEFDWNIASDTTGAVTPNILSELTWRDIALLEIKGGVQHERALDLSSIKGGLYVEADLSLGMPIAGENQDSDFAGDNRTGEFSRTIADSDGGYAVGASAALGYKIYLTGDPKKRAYDVIKRQYSRSSRGYLARTRDMQKALNKATPTITLMPLAGYSVQQQEYTMTSVNQIIPATGPFAIDDFDWHYQSNWYGPFIGLEGEVRGKKSMLRLRGQYHDLSYYGEGFWRGRAGFRQDPSFRHYADGDGLLINAEYAYALGDDYALTIDGTYETRKAEDGDDEVYFTDNTVGRTRLNEVNDESYGMHLGVRYNW